MELGGSQIEKCTDRPIGIYWLYSYRLKFFSSNVKLARDLITDDRSRKKSIIRTGFPFQLGRAVGDLYLYKGKRKKQQT